jgi:hypothetical protein
MPRSLRIWPFFALCLVASLLPAVDFPVAGTYAEAPTSPVVEDGIEYHYTTSHTSGSRLLVTVKAHAVSEIALYDFDIRVAAVAPAATDALTASDTCWIFSIAPFPSWGIAHSAHNDRTIVVYDRANRILYGVIVDKATGAYRELVDEKDVPDLARYVAGSQAVQALFAAKR